MRQWKAIPVALAIAGLAFCSGAALAKPETKDPVKIVFVGSSDSDFINLPATAHAQFSL